MELLNNKFVKVGANCNNAEESLANDFSKIGFEYDKLLKNARFVNKWNCVLSAEVEISNHQFIDKLVFSFAVTITQNSSRPFIHHITVTLLRYFSGSNKSMALIKNHYWNYQGCLPTKEAICNEISGKLKTLSVNMMF